MSEEGTGDGENVGGEAADNPAPRERPFQFPPKPPGAMSPEHTCLGCAMVIALLALSIGFWVYMYWWMEPSYHVHPNKVPAWFGSPTAAPRVSPAPKVKDVKDVKG